MAERAYGLVPVDLITICRELDELAWLLDHDHLKPRYVTFEDGDESVSEERVDGSIRTACQRVLMLIPGNPDFADCSIEQRGFLKALRKTIADPVSLTASTIRSYIRHLEPEQKPAPADEAHEKGPDKNTGGFLKLLKALTGDVAEDKFRKAAEAIGGNGTVNDKLIAVHQHVGIPPTVSANQLAEALEVSATAVKNSRWWKENRYGTRGERTEARRDRHKKRSKELDGENFDDDE